MMNAELVKIKCLQVVAYLEIRQRTIASVSVSLIILQQNII
jgi:hypothetical protein